MVRRRPMKYALMACLFVTCGAWFANILFMPAASWVTSSYAALGDIVMPARDDDRLGWLGELQRSTPPFKAPYPYLISSARFLFIEHDASATRYEVGAIDVMDAKCKLRFAASVDTVVVDVGTNIYPDSMQFRNNESIGMVWVEAQPKVVESLRCSTFKGDRQQFASLPNCSHTEPQDIGTGAILLQQRAHLFAAAMTEHSPRVRDVTMHIAANDGCSSVLPINEATAAPFGTATVDKCLQAVGTVLVPIVQGATLMALIPSHLRVLSLTIDGQGHDLAMLATFGPLAARADILRLECQDLPRGSSEFITHGSFACADIVACVEKCFPHRLVAAKVSASSGSGSAGVQRGCVINNPFSSEYDCVFARQSVPDHVVRQYFHGNYGFGALRQNTSGHQCPSGLGFCV